MRKCLGLIVVVFCMSGCALMPKPDKVNHNCLVFRIDFPVELKKVKLINQSNKDFYAYNLGDNYFALFNVPSGEYILKDAQHSVDYGNKTHIDIFYFSQKCAEKLIYKIDCNQFKYVGISRWKSYVPESDKTMAGNIFGSLLSGGNEIYFSEFEKLVSCDQTTNEIDESFTYLKTQFSNTEWEGMIRKESN